jgi:catechol 2,3-dioxygenase-like lactoylglutathione lyase family enzyme
MPSITGRLSANLSVRDPLRSAVFYSDVLGMDVTYQYPKIIGPDVPMAYVCLREPSTDLEICLVHHATNPGDLFSEFRTGLDHLEFLVAKRADLDEWVAHLDALGVAHSGITEPSYTRNAMLTFRDPDNIQLEFFWRAS